MFKNFRAFTFIATLGFSGLIDAQTVTPAFSITAIATGWNAEQFRILSPQNIVNPANCAVPDGYMGGGAQPGYKTHLATALMAYGMSRQVTVAVHPSLCISDRPVISGLVVL